MARPMPASEDAPPTDDRRGFSRARGVRGNVVLPVVLIVAGLGLGAFGVVQLTAEDPEIARLEEEVAAAEADLAEVEEDTQAAVAHEEQVRAAALELDTQLEALAESVEVTVETQAAVGDALEVWGNGGPYDATQYGAELERIVFPAIADAQAATEDTLALFSDVTAARAELDQLLESEGD